MKEAHLTPFSAWFFPYQHPTGPVHLNQHSDSSVDSSWDNTYTKHRFYQESSGAVLCSVMDKQRRSINY